MDEFVTELEKLRQEHAREFDGVPMEYSPSLCVRIVDYLHLLDELPEAWQLYESDAEVPRTSVDLFISYRTLCRMPVADFEALTARLCPQFLLPFGDYTRATRTMLFLLHCDRWLLLPELRKLHPFPE